MKIRRIGHSPSARPHPTIPDAFVVDLTKGKTTIIGSSDIWAASFNWYAKKARTTWYACRRAVVDGRSRQLHLHREIMAHSGINAFSRDVDHADGDGLNNLRSNLRIATESQNSYNRRRRSDNTSGFKGVYWRKTKQKWCSTITVDKRRRFLGYFDSAGQAAQAYRSAADELHGEFARLP